MNDYLQDLKAGGRPMTKNELKIKELQQRIDKAISYIYVLKNNIKDFKTEYKEDMLNMLDDIGNILGDKENE